MRVVLNLFACGALAAASPAAAATIVLDSNSNTYRDPNGSRNYSELWAAGAARIGIETGLRPQDNGRFAATIEFDLSALPVGAIITSATLSVAPFFWNDSINTLKSYVAASTVPDPARAVAGNLITAFDLQDVYPLYDRPEFTVTSSVKSGFAGAAVNPIIGFSLEQVVDRCVRTQNFNCINSFGTNEIVADRSPKLAVSFDVPTPPVTPGVPEPATWAMMIAGFGAVGASLRRRRKVLYA